VEHRASRAGARCHGLTFGPIAVADPQGQVVGSADNHIDAGGLSHVSD